jgi:hypothetical protein
MQAGRDVRLAELPRAEGQKKIDLNEYLHDEITQLPPPRDA